MANQNGISNAGYTGMNGNIMPSAGHYSDMQTLMHNMETLSGWLQQNREEWVQVQEGLARVERLQGRLARDDTGQLQSLLQNGDANESVEALQEDPNEPTVPQLQAALAAAEDRVASLESTYRDQIKLQQLFEDTLTDTTERIRHYCFEQQNHIIALHQHYTTLLQQSRNETVEAQLTHQGWQAGLKRVSEGVRMAMKAREEEGRPWKARIAALKEENRILRAKVGWDPPVDSEEEEEDDDEEPEYPERELRGRGGQSVGQTTHAGLEGGVQERVVQ